SSAGHRRASAGGGRKDRPRPGSPAAPAVPGRAVYASSQLPFPPGGRAGPPPLQHHIGACPPAARPARGETAQPPPAAPARAPRAAPVRAAPAARSPQLGSAAPPGPAPVAAPLVGPDPAC